MITNRQCPICGRVVILAGDPAHRTHYYDCVRCGPFHFPDVIQSILSSSPLSGRQSANASAWIRENPEVTILEDTLTMFQRLQAPSVAERAEKLLVYLARKNPDPGTEIVFPWNEEESKDPTTAMVQIMREAARIDPALFSVSWSETSVELKYLIEDYLTNTKQFLRQDDRHRHNISPEGWAFLDDLRKTNKGSTLVFVAMSFNPNLKPLFDNWIKPAVKAAGYDAQRVDSEDHVDRIDDRIFALINRSRFIVADFTRQSDGVYFEAGYALGMGLKVIWSCREDELAKLHFDAAHYNMLGWTADNLPDYRTRLKSRIEAVIR